MAGKKRAYTPKQMGDACEMLVAAEMTLAGVPAFRAPDHWRGYDLIAQPEGEKPQRISVKSRTFKRGPEYFGWNDADEFEWIALVILPGGEQDRRHVFVIPRRAAEDKGLRQRPTDKTPAGYGCQVDKVSEKYAAFENNFSLAPTGSATENRK